MRAHDEPIGCVDHCRYVLDRVPRRSQESNGVRQHSALGVVVAPQVAAVDGGEVVEARSWEECGVECVVDVLVTEDHVGDLLRIDPEGPQGFKNGARCRDQARVDDDMGVAFGEVGHR